jgi:hypothetical protein
MRESIESVLIVRSELRECKLHNIIQSAAWLRSVLCLASDMGLHYLMFMEEDFEHKQKPTLLYIMDSVGLNSKNIVDGCQ